MLEFWDRCPVNGRRSFLQAGFLGLSGLLSHSLVSAGVQHPAILADRSVIFLFLHGGPSQIETFDPKMTAPVGIQSVNGEIQTAVPGITFGSCLPKLAALADKFSVVRSFTLATAITTLNQSSAVIA